MTYSRSYRAIRHAVAQRLAFSTRTIVSDRRFPSAHIRFVSKPFATMGGGAAAERVDTSARLAALRALMKDTANNVQA